MDRGGLEQRLARIDAKIAGVAQQIREQRQVIDELERAGRPAGHAKYLLAGLTLLDQAYRKSREAMQADVTC